MQWLCINMCNTFELCSCLGSFRLKYLWHNLRYALVLRGRKPNSANKMYQCNKNYCQSAYTKAPLSYNCYAVNTSVAVQQCDFYRTSSMFKVGFSSIIMWRVTFMPSSDHVCPIDDTTVTCTEVVRHTLRS